ncbi:MAG: hypothetical protein R8M70_00105 [Alphaproteobacteria bacterium]|nr:hypothetical protein [Alphaproteobacteria bacterium]
MQVYKGVFYENIVVPPKNKCFYYMNTAEIIIANKNIKTVPVLGFDYKYLTDSYDEAFERPTELAMDKYFQCEYHFEHGNNSLKEEDLNFCDCEKQAALDALDGLSFEEGLEQCAKKYPKAKADSKLRL